MTSSQLWKKQTELIPGGAQTFSKMPNQYACEPKLLHRGIGCRVWDTDGNEYIDCSMGLGAIILGHCNREVNEAVKKCADDLFVLPSLPHPKEAELAEKLCELIPCAEMVKFAKNGSDVTDAAVRLARHITGEDTVACCGYHGWHDWYVGAIGMANGVLWGNGSGVVCFRYNDIDSLVRIFDERDVACVIMEPISFEPPQSKFLWQVRSLCDKNGALLIFDEIVIWPRYSLYFGAIPDLVTIGKAMANGYPLSALVGRRKYMERLNGIFFSTTFGGELPSMAASMKTIEIIQRDMVLERIWEMGKKLIDGMKGMGMNTYGYPCWPKYEFETPEQMTLFNQELIKRGLLTRNTIFLSYEHKEPDIREILRAMKESFEVVKKGGKLEYPIIEPVIRDRMVDH